MRLYRLLPLGLCLLSCGQDVAGANLATLQVGVQGLYENTAEIDLPAGPTAIDATAVASASVIAVKVSVSQNGRVLAVVPLELPNSKIPEGEITSASTSVTLAVGETRRVDLFLLFGAAAGSSTPSGIDFNISFSQDKPAPTVDYFFIYPGPTFTPKQPCKLEVFATNHVGMASELKVTASIKNGAGTLVGSPASLAYTSGRFTTTLTAPDVLGDYTLEIRASDARPATTIDSKTIHVAK